MSDDAKKAAVSARQKQLRADRKAWGLCVECGKKPPFNGRVRCEDCLCRDLLAHHKTKDSQQRMDKRKRIRAERKAAGLCIWCGKPVYRSYVRCYECYIKNRRARNKYREKHNTGRIKPWNPPPPPRKQSADHPWNKMNRLIRKERDT